MSHAITRITRGKSKEDLATIAKKLDHEMRYGRHTKEHEQLWLEIRQWPTFYGYKDGPTSSGDVSNRQTAIKKSGGTSGIDQKGITPVSRTAGVRGTKTNLSNRTDAVGNVVSKIGVAVKKKANERSARKKKEKGEREAIRQSKETEDRHAQPIQLRETKAIPDTQPIGRRRSDRRSSGKGGATKGVNVKMG